MYQRCKMKKGELLRDFFFGNFLLRSVLEQKKEKTVQYSLLTHAALSELRNATAASSTAANEL
jgi:hypothetical protein